MRQRDKERVLQWWFVERERYEKLSNEILRLFDAELDPRVPADNLYTMRSRLKHDDRLLEKVDSHFQGAAPVVAKTPQIVADLLGLRLICLRLADVDRVKDFVGALEKEGQLDFVTPPEEKKTFILPVNPGDAIPGNLDLQYTGYSSIHYQVRLGPSAPAATVLSGLEAEIQVRTILEEAWGEIDHKYRYELSRVGVALPDQVRLGFYSFGAYLQAAALQAEYLARATEGIAAAANVDAPTAATEIARPRQKSDVVRRSLQKLVGFEPSDQTLAYLFRRSRQHELEIVPVSSWLPPSRIDTFRETYQRTFGVPPFQLLADRQVDLVNLANFGLQAAKGGERTATRGLVSVLRRRRNLTESGEQSFVLRKPATGDDDYWARTINFAEVRRLALTVIPKPPTDYWRFGIKFRADDRFDEQRYGPGTALFHLAKPAGTRELHWVYIDAHGGNSGEQPLLLHYTNSPVTISCTPSGGKFQIEVFNKDGVLQLRHEYADAGHRLARVFAWGDGQDYSLTVEAVVT